MLRSLDLMIEKLIVIGTCSNLTKALLQYAFIRYFVEVFLVNLVVV